MDERTPLFNKSSTAINDGGVLPRFISDPRLIGKQRFKWAVPSQETEEAHKQRFMSIKLCYVIMFLTSVSFTISISSMWPYLLIIDKTTDTSFFGWIVSAYSIGQLISSPFFGWWANKIRYHKLPIIVCLHIMAAGNVIYLYLESFGQTGLLSPKAWMLIARFIMGLGAACAAVVRSYCSSATNIQERTSTLSNISACQGIGFILGPVLQAAFVPIGFPGLINMTEFHLNMYTSPALLSIVIYLGLAFMTAFYFQEYVVLDNATQNDTAKVVETTNRNDSYSETLKNLPPPDYYAVFYTLLLFFINCFVFSFFETLSSPLTIDMYAWSKSQATLYNGIILGVIGILSVIVVLVGKILAKKYKEKILMLGGYVILLISIIALLPWGHDYPSLQIPTIVPGKRNTTTSMTSTTTSTLFTSTEESPRGCPLDYDWCLYTPIVKMWQFLLGFTLLVIGYSIANVMSFAIYSKILGPIPQGLWMGILTSFGSLSRAVGPIVVAYLYGLYGPRVSFIFLSGIVFVATVIIVFTFKRYEPYKFS